MPAICPVRLRRMSGTTANTHPAAEPKKNEQHIMAPTASAIGQSLVIVDSTKNPIAAPINKITRDFLRPNLSLIQPPDGQEPISTAAKQAPSTPAKATGTAKVPWKNIGNMDTTANSEPKVTA